MWWVEVRVRVCVYYITWKVGLILLPNVVLRYNPKLTVVELLNTLFTTGNIINKHSRECIYLLHGETVNVCTLPLARPRFRPLRNDFSRRHSTYRYVQRRGGVSKRRSDTPKTYFVNHHVLNPWSDPRRVLFKQTGLIGGYALRGCFDAEHVSQSGRSPFVPVFEFAKIIGTKGFTCSLNFRVRFVFLRAIKCFQKLTHTHMCAQYIKFSCVYYTCIYICGSVIDIYMCLFFIGVMVYFNCWV